MIMRLTLSMASYGRPQRTIRAINSIANQNINGWEALVIGDGCPVMQDFIDSEYFAGLIDQCSYNGNFRKQHAGINYIYDSIKDKFISPQPHQSWSLDNNDDWQAPISYPITYTLNLTNLDGTQKQDPYIWNEVNQSWDLQSIS